MNLNTGELSSLAYLGEALLDDPAKFSELLDLVETMPRQSIPHQPKEEFLQVTRIIRGVQDEIDPAIFSRETIVAKALDLLETIGPSRIAGIVLATGAEKWYLSQKQDLSPQNKIAVAALATWRQREAGVTRL